MLPPASVREFGVDEFVSEVDRVGLMPIGRDIFGPALFPHLADRPGHARRELHPRFDDLAPAARRAEGKAEIGLGRREPRLGILVEHADRIEDVVVEQPKERLAIVAALHFAAFFPAIISRKRCAQPGFTSCLARASPSAFASTSPVTTDPAPTIAPSPIFTGATSALFDPIKAPCPISVLYLRKPS